MNNQTPQQKDFSEQKVLKRVNCNKTLKTRLNSKLYIYSISQTILIKYYKDCSDTNTKQAFEKLFNIPLYNFLDH